jgi:hypothetical protein
MTYPDPIDQLAARMSQLCGYGTLGHLVGVLLHDREIVDSEQHEAIIAAADAHSDELWDLVVGPMLDQLENALLEAIR